jgi:hypothetical protein
VRQTRTPLHAKRLAMWLAQLALHPIGLRRHKGGPDESRTRPTPRRPLSTTQAQCAADRPGRGSASNQVFFVLETAIPRNSRLNCVQPSIRSARKGWSRISAATTFTTVSYTRSIVPFIAREHSVHWPGRPWISESSSIETGS